MPSFSLRLPHRAARPELSFMGLWRNVTFMTALVTFAALLGTGELSPVATTLFLGAWLVGYVVRSTPGWWRGWMGTALTIFAVFILGQVARRGDYFESVLYLLLFLLIVKCYSLKSSRDHLQAQLLCFFTLLSTAVITVAFYFLLVFVVYLFLAALAFSLYGIARQRDRALAIAASGAAPRLEDAAPAPALPKRFLRGSFAAMMLHLFFVAFFFVFVPHISIQQYSAPLSRREIPPERLTGFSDEVTFGEFKRITPNQQVVMRIELSWPDGVPKTRPESLLMRGLALDDYDEKSWKRSPAHSERPGYETARQISPVIKSAQKGKSASRNTRLHVLQDTDISTRIFAAPLPILIDLDRRLRLRLDPPLGGAQVTSFGKTRESSYTNPLRYEVTSNLIDEASGHLSELAAYQRKYDAIRSKTLLKAGTDDIRIADAFDAIKSEEKLPQPLSWLSHGKTLMLTPEERMINTQMPKTTMTEEIEALSRKIAPRENPPEIALDLIRHFHTKFEYTFEPDTPPGEHPIHAFLFNTHKGHCEYFATAFVLMLRSRGIPARIVNGFYTAEWNDWADVFIVRQADAHSWAEVWLDETGWLTIDPTPPGSAGRAAYGLGGPSIFENWSEYLRIQWQRFVIDYSSSKQVMVFDRIRSIPGFRLLFNAMDYARDKAVSAQEKPEDKAKPESSSRMRILGDATILLSIVFLGWLAARAGFRRARRGRDRSGIDYLDEALDLLEKRGVRRLPSQTPAELAQSILIPEGLRSELDWLVALYYRQKYSGVSPEQGERKRAAAALDMLRASPKFSAT